MVSSMNDIDQQILQYRRINGLPVAVIKATLMQILSANLKADI